MRSQLLFSLFLAWPLFAQEKAARLPVREPESMDQLLLDRLIAGVAYASYDEDGDGLCNAAERAPLLARLRFDYDVNDSGQLDPEEQLAAFHDACIKENEARYPAIFVFWPSPWSIPVSLRHWTINAKSLYDQDQNDRLSADELRRALAIEYYATTGLQEKADADADGHLDEKEFQTVMKKRREADADADGTITADEIWYHAEKTRAVGLLRSSSWLESQREEEPAEKLLKRYAQKIDLDGDGQVTNDEILMLVPRDILINPRIEFSTISLWQQFLSRQPAAPDAALLPVYDADRNGKWCLTELAHAAQQEQRLRTVYVEDYLPGLADGKERLISYRRAGMLGPGERQKLTDWLLKQGGDKNGKLDQEVNRRFIHVRMRQPLAIAGSLPMPRQLYPFLDSAKRQACEKTALELYDWNHDNRLALPEMRQAIMLEQAFTSFVSFGKVPVTGKPSVPLLLSIPEKRAWLAKCLPVYDRDGNGRWDEEEILRFCREEPLWLRLGQSHKEFDQDQDGWLNAGERQLAATALIPEYDINHNLRLDHRELQAGAEAAAAMDGIPALSPGKPQDKIQNKAWLLGLFDFDRNGVLDAEEGQIARLTVMICWPNRWPAGLQFRRQNGLDGRKLCESLLEDWRKTQDRNGDGVLNIAEAINALRTEDLLIDAWDKDCDWIREAVLEWKEFMAMARQDGDIDGDGRLSLAEVRRIRYLFRAKGKLRERLSLSLAKGKPLGTYEENMKEWTSAFDLNGNGRFDAEEIDQAYSLLVRSPDGWLRDLDPQFKDTVKSPVGLDVLRKGYDIALKKYDENQNGILDSAEWQILKDYMDGLAAQRRQAAKNEQLIQAEARKMADWLKKYDLNGNGKLDPEERTRAEKDSKAGIQSPAIDE